LGGHLTLWDLKLVIRFLLGATILIPSHPQEKHFSFVQYTAGGLFRPREEKMECTKEAKTRWEKGVAMYSTVDSLKSGPSVPSI
ncbi:hypothetical protein C8F04DRAFT_1157040, partial [Mycena alexandri]